VVNLLMRSRLKMNQKTMTRNDNFSAADEQWMQQALDLARTAAQQNEVPVGAILVLDQQLLGSGFNQPISSNDPTAHAEIMALRQAAGHLQNYRLINTTLYVTLEPCPMCAFALLHARVQRVVYASQDPKTGAFGGAIDLLAAHRWNHQLKCEQGLLAEPCGQLLRDFFKARR